MKLTGRLITLTNMYLFRDIGSIRIFHSIPKIYGKPTKRNQEKTPKLKKGSFQKNEFNSDHTLFIDYQKSNKHEKICWRP